ncbi:hypothetical protein F5Y07DRAFT_371775 [Xylaria sp. FL0933]|nr:hypothetical protein F5Y07DRAFT_371775 [Xylaria sp. FL0933]
MSARAASVMSARVVIFQCVSLGRADTLRVAILRTAGSFVNNQIGQYHNGERLWLVGGTITVLTSDRSCVWTEGGVSHRIKQFPSRFR